MIADYVNQLGRELDMGEYISSPEPDLYKLIFDGGIEVEAYHAGQGPYTFEGIIGPSPDKNAEDVFTKVMEANLFGKGTNGAAIGLDEEGKQFTLSMEIDYNIPYGEWKDMLEDFVNTLHYWREQTKPAVP